MKEFLEEQRDNNTHLIDVRDYSTKKADEYFKAEFEDRLAHAELYEIENPDNPNSGYVLKYPYSDIYWDKVDEIEEELLDYRNKIYEELNID